MSFITSILNNSKKFDEPFTHWELNKPLTEGAIQEITKADIANPVEYNLKYGNIGVTENELMQVI